MLSFTNVVRECYTSKLALYLQDFNHHLHMRTCISEHIYLSYFLIIFDFQFLKIIEGVQFKPNIYCLSCRCKRESHRLLLLIQKVLERHFAMIIF